MHTSNSRLGIGHKLLAASLPLTLTAALALTGCSDPGTNVVQEKDKDQATFDSYSDLSKITDPNEMTAAKALKAAGADVFVSEGSVITVAFQNGGCDDAIAAHLKHTPNVTQLMLMGCSKVTDASVDTIAGLKKLTAVMLTDTGITNAGAMKIKNGLPDNAMVMHPATEGATRRAAGGGGP
jgi:hypothetical protein